MRVVFVCLGNICRSPAAEGIMRDLSPEITVDSAGTRGWHIGEPPYGPMQAAALARGIDLSSLRARQFVPADFDRFDLIVAMDRQNMADIEDIRPDGSKTPVCMMADQDIPDPYYTRDFDGTLDMIASAATTICS